MKPANYLILATAPSLFFAASAVPGAENASTGQILDPATVAWPRTFTTDGCDMGIFQPQISTWIGNQLAGRFAVGIRPTGSKDEGSVATLQECFDKLGRIVPSSAEVQGSVIFFQLCGGALKTAITSGLSFAVCWAYRPAESH